MPRAGGQSKLNAFVDLGYSPGRDFAKFLFASPEFNVVTLRRLVKSWKGARKDDYASELSSQLENGNIAPKRILRAWVTQPRRWLSLKLGNPKVLPRLEPPDQLLTSFGGDQWYGPVLDQDQNARWYIRTQTVPHWRVSGKTATQARIRWTVIAEVSDSHLALSWDNFTHKELEEHGGLSQYQFWNDIPFFFSDLEGDLGGTWEHPVLHKLVLDDLWSAYMMNPEYAWQHIRIRAERSGVALSARSAGVAEVDVEGLAKLTRKLAESASGAVGIQAERDIRKIDRALLRTMIRDWGTNSYEFSIDRRDAGKYGKLFRAHCYFGLRPELENEDSLQHLMCSLAYGGSKSAQEFILGHL